MADDAFRRAPLEIYRPFFLAGIVVVLTAGCLLGAIALVGIAFRESYVAPIWAPFILAHANSQLFGWVGFFVMGFALQQHGTSVARLDSFRRISRWTLGSMAGGIILRFAAEYLSSRASGQWVWLGILAGVLQLVAVILFFVNTGRNRFRTGEPLRWPALFVFTSLGWLLAVSTLDPFVFAYAHQVDASASIQFVAKWMSPLREAQFLGFVAMMIFGVAASKFSECLGLRPAIRAWGLFAYGAWTTGLLLRIVGWVIYFNSSMQPDSAWIYRAGAGALWLGVVAMSISLRVFEPSLDKNQSQLFIRSAFVWLIVAGLMLVLEPVHLSAIHAPFSHAYTGGVRHALTVGFISQMILGVGFHVASRMAGVQNPFLPSLVWVWALVNLGNCGRVILEIATDYSRTAYAPMGFTGFIELAGLAIWSGAMLRFLLAKPEPLGANC